MAHPRHPLPAWTPITSCAAVVAPLVALVLALLPWIPTWRGPMRIGAIAITIAGVTAALAYAVARIRSPSGVSRPRKVAMVLVLIGQLLSVALVCLSLVEFFPPAYAYSLDTSAARVYVYNSGFLEQEVMVLVQLAPLPIHVPLRNAPRCPSLEVELESDGHTLLVCGRRCDVRTRNCEIGKP